jgi:hypothetical protein
VRAKQTTPDPNKPARRLPEGLQLTPPVSEGDPTGIDRLRRKLIRGGRAGWTYSELLRATSLRTRDLKWALDRLRAREEVEVIAAGAAPAVYRCTADTRSPAIKRPGRPPKARPEAAAPALPPEDPHAIPSDYIPGAPCEFDGVVELKWYRRVGFHLTPNQHLERRCGSRECTNPDHHMLHTVFNRKEMSW